MRRSHLLAAAAAAGVATAASADLTVVSGSGQRALQVAYYGPLGQSFTAGDTDLTSFGFQFETFNSGQPNTPLTLTLRTGAGLTGVVVATRTATLPAIPAFVATWYDFDITGTTLIAGATYTALVSTSSSLLGFAYGPDIDIFTGVPRGGDAYAGGRLVASRDLNLDSICAMGICDANFRFAGSSPAAAVPEPAAWLLLVAGFGLIGWRRRRPVTVAA